MRNRIPDDTISWGLILWFGSFVGGDGVESGDEEELVYATMMSSEKIVEI